MSKVVREFGETPASARGPMVAHFLNRIREIEAQHNGVVNLIASENRLSSMARRLLSLDASSRYFFEGSDPPAFPGGALFSEIQLEGERILRQLGRAHYANMRPLSGLHAMTVLMAALTEPGDTILSLSQTSGGHYATGPLAQRMGRRHVTFSLEQDLTISECQLAEQLERSRPKLLYIDQCHGLFPIDVRRITSVARQVSSFTLVHADVSHGLGLVLGGVIENPLHAGCDSFGGSTHKTFPGPQKGVLLTSNDEIAKRISSAQYHLISNHHLSAAICLSAALWEFSIYGGETYAAAVPTTANDLAHALVKNGVFPVQLSNQFSGWHQLWVAQKGLPNDASTCASRLASAGVMVNLLPDLPGIASHALRLGVSEITHLGLTQEATQRLGELICKIIHSDLPAESFRPAIAELVVEAARPYDYGTEEEYLSGLSLESDDCAQCIPWTPITEPTELQAFTVGRGVYVTDHRGKSYLDAKSGALNATLGYGRTDIAEVAHDQLIRLMNCNAVGSVNAPSLALARRISKLTDDGLPHTLFCNSGSEAAEAALKIALICQQSFGEPQRRRFVTYANGYHGCTLGALALTQLEFPKAGLDWLPADLSIPLPMPVDDDHGIIEIANLLNGAAGMEIAAVLLEPIQGIGGIRPFPNSYLVALRQLCDRAGVLLIMDEVFTGFGRTGRMFAFEHAHVTPDILLTSKGLTAGYAALSAVSMTTRVLNALEKDPYFAGIRHGHTMSGHATACAIALKVIDILVSEDIPARAEQVGNHLLDRLSLLMKWPHVVDVRGKGLMLGIEVASDDIASFVVEACREDGLLIRSQAGVIQIVPPLTISHNHADLIGDRLEIGLRTAATRFDTCLMSQT